MYKPIYKVMFVVAIAVAACGKGSPGNGSASSKETPARPEKLDQLAAELAAIASEPPAPTPTLPDGVAVTVQNTLVVTGADLALQRKQPREPSVRVPARTPLVEMLAQARGGALHDKGMITEASRDTALRSIDALKYIAVIEERVYLDEISRNRVGFWDRGAKAWVGALWVSVGLTDKPDKTMARFRKGVQVGAAFTVSETPEERMVRHRQELRGVLDKALTERAQQWETGGPLPTEAKEEVTPFVPDHVPTYKLPVPNGSPVLGRADAKATVQIFSRHGSPGIARMIVHLAQVYGDRVRIVWRDYPLSFQKDSEPAAEVGREVLAAKGAPAFWEYMERFAAVHTASLADMPVADIVKVAEQVGLDAARARAAIDKHTYKNAIDADVAALQSLPLDIQPAVAAFVNGWRVLFISFPSLTAPIDYALAH
jgi:hypothetical protein